mmetsp:Transcript_8892/g.13821  ORF Transcript_8892/g.13821 Transcript_8892/m.13821 type:complete len:86 (+) Transcript_8892:67-324(+)
MESERRATMKYVFTILKLVFSLSRHDVKFMIVTKAVEVNKPRIAALSCLGSRAAVDADSLVQGVLDSDPDVIVLLGDNYFRRQVT